MKNKIISIKSKIDEREYESIIRSLDGRQTRDLILRIALENVAVKDKAMKTIIDQAFLFLSEYSFRDFALLVDFIDKNQELDKNLVTLIKHETERRFKKFNKDIKSVQKISRDLHKLALSNSTKNEKRIANLRRKLIRNKDKIDKISLKQLAQVTNFFAKAKLIDTSLFKLLGDNVIYLLKNSRYYNERELSLPEAKQLTLLIYSFAKARYKDDELYRELSIKVQQHRRMFSPFDLTKISWALSYIDYSEDNYSDMTYQAIISEVKNSLELFSITDLIVLGFSTTVSGYYDKELIDYIIARTNKEGDIEDRHISMLTTIMNIAEIKNIDLDNRFSDNLLNQITKMLIDTSRKPEPSPTHMKVSAILEKLGIAHEIEYPYKNYFIDCAIFNHNGRKIALESDGPSHYDLSGKHLIGFAKQKDKVLEFGNWEVVRIKTLGKADEALWEKQIKEALNI